MRDVPHHDRDLPRKSTGTDRSFSRSRGLAAIVVALILWSVTLLAVSALSPEARVMMAGEGAWLPAAETGGAFPADR